MTVRALVAAGFFAGTLATAAGAQAAFEVVVSASPSAVRVGQPIEILVRTFIPVQKDVLDVSNPREPYPGRSGLWNVLYPMDDYPFDVVAEHEDGTEIPVTVARDPSDSTLWRGIAALPMAGTWTIRVRNFSPGPGATTAVRAEPAPPISIEAGAAAAAGVLLGLSAGVLLGRRWPRVEPRM